VYVRDGCGIFSLIFYFKIYFVPNGYRVGAGYVLVFKQTFYAGFPCFALRISNVIPASGGFVYGGGQGGQLVNESISE
jgi:hypothetical protein